MRTPPRLAEHLRAWVGAWPPRGALTVVGVPAREAPGWDGRVRRVLGVGDGDGVVLAVPPWAAERVRALGGDLDEPAYGRGLAAAVRTPDRGLGRDVFRWSTDPAPARDAGVWVPPTDPRVPAWLHPFNGDVLVALDGDRVLAGVGLKRHDPAGWEIAVVTEPDARGRGLATRLVAQAARATLAAGAVPTYRHDATNIASARTAAAAGFPDRGWRSYGLWTRSA